MADDQKPKQEPKQKQQASGAQAQQPARQSSSSVNIVRIAGRDINANYKIARALDEVKGIGHNLANAMALVAKEKLGIDEQSLIGSLSEEQLHNLENMLKDPVSSGIPAFMVNRNKDPETGANMHVIGTDLIVTTRQDIDREIKIMTWRGYRHQFGQKVRGQRTRSTGRTGETVGVTKKRVEEEMKKAAQTEKKGGEAAGAGAQAAQPAAK